MEKHTISSGIEKRGYGLHQFFSEEYAQLSQKLGIADYENKSPSQWKAELLKALDVTPHARPVMTMAERTAKQVNKLGESLGVAPEKIAEAKKLLGL